MSDVNYGPLNGLIGTWSGDKGTDWSPEKDGLNDNEYYETIVFTPAGDVENAEEQVLCSLHYHQVVKKKSNDEVFHNETGYWIWDEKEQTVMHSFTIPRGVCVLAGGKCDGKKDAEGNIIIEVQATAADKDWGIIQAPFMSKRAKTTKFVQKLVVGDGKFSYHETTTVDIYGRVFEHTDENELTLQK